MHPFVVKGTALPWSLPAAITHTRRDALMEVAKRRQHLSQAGEEGFDSRGFAGCQQDTANAALTAGVSRW